jgi:hypothetical protein
MTLKGRHWLLLWLLLFLATAVAVVARQGDALRTARRLGRLREGRVTLEGAREELRRQIRTATSRSVLVPLMERAGFHLPSDSENTLIRVDTLGASRGRGGGP